MCPVCVYLWVEILKYNFKSILEKKDQNFSMRGLCSVCHTWNIYRSAPIPRNLPCPKKFLVARLKLKKQSSGSALSKDVLRILLKFTKNIFAGISFLIKLQGGNLKLSDTATGDIPQNELFLKILQVSQESLSKKFAVLGACNFIKKDSSTGGFLWILLIIQEHLFLKSTYERLVLKHWCGSYSLKMMQAWWPDGLEAFNSIRKKL